jgi:broad specificity phosphatase PhoE
LGVRIASLLRAPEFTGKLSEGHHGQSSASGDSANLQPTPAPSDLYHRYNVIVHTSPYLRCLQTAIAVGAGLNQSLSETEAPESTKPTHVPPTGDVNTDSRSLLRVDSFLGEWLSPDYFDQIVPPPASDRMVASAKAELLRRGDLIFTAREGTRALSGHFPGGWGSQSHPSSPSEEEDRRLAPRASSATSAQYGQRQRASTYDTLQSPQGNRTPKGLGRLNTDPPPISDTSYVPPTPGYAISASDPIPVGYVAHARDACTKIDYQWDSMRTPFWGTGGEYGEEWSSMHERVHDGFRRMVDWYRRQDGPSAEGIVSNGADKDRPKETVLIIITHGADCNALISSLAGHSVLLDINTASLTMAVRRDRLKSTAPLTESAFNSRARRDDFVSREYALQLVASTDHLRAGANPSQLTALSSPSAPQPVAVPAIPTYRNRLGSRPSMLQGSFTIGPTPGYSLSPRSWSLARQSTVPRGTAGLWGAVSSPDKDDDAEDFVPNFGDPRPMSEDSSHTEGSGDRSGWKKQLPQRTLSQRGLWGSAPALEDREAASRRRWTVTEQKL